MATTDGRVVLPCSIKPTHYELVLSPNLETLLFSCSEKVIIDVITATNTITMHSKEIEVVSATLDGQNATMEYDVKATTVTFTFPALLTVGANQVLAIEYNGILNGDMAGFYKSSYTDAQGVKKVMASTQFEALDARRGFICYDEPGAKATFKVVLVVQKDLTAISNMPETSVLHLPDGNKRVEFGTSPVMSTYLCAWAIGEMDMVQAYTKDGVSIRIFAPPGRAEHGKFALDAGVRALEFYNDFFEVAYPLPKLDMLCVTEFAMGAMENWGLVTYREVDLMIDAQKASSQQRQRVAIVVAHELAHQWFGNLVTMEWWNGLWLNEGFAAFMEHYCVDSLYPEYKIWEQFTTDAFGAAQRLDSLRSSHPVIVPIKHAEEVEQVFDAISYCKGSCCVNMVKNVIGLDSFRRGLKSYFQKYKYGNANTDQLWAEWSEASGMDIGALMNVWTTEMGYPYLSVVDEKWGPAAVVITLEQAWFLSDGSAKPDEGALWQIPLQFATPGGITPAAPVIMTQKRQTFTVDFGAQVNGQQNWVKINADQKFLVRVAHSLEMSRKLQPALSQGALSAVDRAAVLLDSYNLAKAGLAPVNTVLLILVALQNEKSSTVFSAMSMVLGGLHLLTEQVSTECHDSFVQLGSKIITSALSSCGWDPKPTDTHTEKLYRASCIGLLDAFCGSTDSVVAEAKRRFEGHFHDPALLPSDYKTTVFKIIMKNGGASEYDRILATFYDTEDNAERKYAMSSLGSTKDLALKTRTLDWAVKSGDVKLQDFFYAIGSVAGDAAGTALSWQYLKDNFQHIKEMLAKASPSLMDAVIMFTCGKFCTYALADELEAFFEKNPLPSSSRRISQLLENIRTNALFLDRIKDSDFNAVLAKCLQGM